MSNDARPDLTRQALVIAIEDLLRAADRLGLAEVGIKLNEAVVVLGRDGVVPPVDEHAIPQALEAMHEEGAAPTRH